MLQNTREATLAAGARRGDRPRRTGGRCLWPPAWLDRGRLRGAEHPSQRVKTTKPGEIPPFHMLIQHGANRQPGLRRPQRDVEGSNPGPSLTAPHEPGAVGTRQHAGCRAGEEQTSLLCRPVGAAAAVCSRRRGLQLPLRCGRAWRQALGTVVPGKCLRPSSGLIQPTATSQSCATAH